MVLTKVKSVMTMVISMGMQVAQMPGHTNLEIHSNMD
jgi:hypothetical protein